MKQKEQKMRNEVERTQRSVRLIATVWSFVKLIYARIYRVLFNPLSRVIHRAREKFLFFSSSFICSGGNLPVTEIISVGFDTEWTGVNCDYSIFFSAFSFCIKYAWRTHIDAGDTTELVKFAKSAPTTKIKWNLKEKKSGRAQCPSSCTHNHTMLKVHVWIHKSPVSNCHRRTVRSISLVEIASVVHIFTWNVLDANQRWIERTKKKKQKCKCLTSVEYITSNICDRRAAHMQQACTSVYCVRCVGTCDMQMFNKLIHSVHAPHNTYVCAVGASSPPHPSQIVSTIVIAGAGAAVCTANTCKCISANTGLTSTPLSSAPICLFRAMKCLTWFSFLYRIGYHNNQNGCTYTHTRRSFNLIRAQVNARSMPKSALDSDATDMNKLEEHARASERTRENEKSVVKEDTSHDRIEITHKNA